jgi:CubicO group peptidase (beta-lactamase class C family)
MMRGMIRHLIAVLVPIAAAPLAAQDAPPPATVVVHFDRETIRPLIVEGLADKKAGRPLEANDPVRIASVSKLIMALAALRLRAEGKVDLDRDVTDYLGWKLRSPRHPDAPVTLTHLLMHRAGLSDAGGYSIGLGESLAAKLAAPASWRDTGPPGAAAFEYANLGSPVVATVLEAASGERYDRLVERLVFAPLGVKACFNWIGCGPDMAARAVTLYRHTGEVAADGPDRLPPACTIPVAEGQACDLDAYVPGTNASVFSPQGGLRIGMVDLAKIGRALAAEQDGVFARATMLPARDALLAGRNPGQALFCRYGLAMQLIEADEGPEDTDETCDDALFGRGVPYIGHSGEAYGLLSGLFFDTHEGRGFAYFTTENPPPAGGEDTGTFSARERMLMAQALLLAGD